MMVLYKKRKISEIKIFSNKGIIERNSYSDKRRLGSVVYSLVGIDKKVEESSLFKSKDDLVKSLLDNYCEDVEDRRIRATSEDHF